MVKKKEPNPENQGRRGPEASRNTWPGDPGRPRPTEGPRQRLTAVWRGAPGPRTVGEWRRAERRSAD